MGGDPAASESVPARGVTGLRGGRRGRCWGDILGYCSYSRAGGRGHNGGGVGFHGRGPLIIAACVCLVYHHQSAVRITVFLPCLGWFPKFVNRRNG